MELIIDNTVEATEYNNVEVIIPSQIDVVEEVAEFEVSVVKKEYTIIGDSIFIPSTYEDAPPWLKEFINTTIDVAVTNRDQSLIDRMNSILTVMEYVPKNQYTEQINQIVNEDGIINSRIATLNSNLTDAINSSNATIAEINLTYASKTEAAAIVTNALTASLSSSGEIGSVLIQLQEAYASLESTTAQQITMLESVMEGEITGNAQAMQTLRTYVGVDPNGGVTGTGLLADVQILQKQNDGVIETVTGTYDVMINPENPELAELILTAEPYATWRAADVTGVDTRLAHIGDVYIKYNITANGAREYIASFKFIRTVVDATDAHKSTDADGFTWAMIIDQAAQDAYNQALNAYDLADNKRRVFVGLGAASTPKVPYDQGDLWLIDAARVVNGYNCKVGDILRCIESKVVEGATYEQNDWVLASSYTNAIKAEADALENWKNTTYANTITSIQTQVDKKAETFYQSSVPTGRLTLTNVVADVGLDKYIGDLWKNTYVGTVGGYLGNNTEYIYSKIANGTKWDYKWIKMEVPDIVFDTIDTKKSIYSGNTVPVAVSPDVIEVNDMWITGDNPVSPYVAKSIYVWNGTAWALPVRYTDDQYAKDIVAGTTQIDLSDHINSLGWTDDATVDEFIISTYAKDMLNIGNQLDGVAVTYFQATKPYLESVGLSEHSGDVWFNTSNETAFKFVYKTVDASGNMLTPSIWEPITNTVILNALKAASKTKAAADRSIKNFTTTTVPSHPFYIGDTWMEGSSGNIYVCNANSLSSDTETQRRAKWVIASKYTDDTAVTALQTGLANGTTTIKLTNAYVGTVPLTTYLSSEIDNKVGVYSGTTAPVAGQPSGVAVNDIYLWFTTQTASGKTYDITRTYKYSGSVWNEITTNDDITNLADLADGKRTVFGGNVVPTGAVERDLWIPSANVSSYIKGEIYQYISGVWSPTTRYTADIQALTSNVQAQIDSKVDTYYQDTVPFANATNVARKTQAGDYWYCTLTAGSYVKGKMYKYVETANGSNWNYTWTETADVTKYAFDLADGKASIFTTSAQPSSYKINDMLIVTTASFSNGTTTFSNGVVLTSNATRTAGFVAADWIKKINDTEDLDAFVSGVYEPKVASLQSQVDGKIESWYTVSTSDPKVAWTTAEIRLQHNGDMWYQTDTKKSYWYSNVTHSWNLIEDQTAITALANAATAQATADGVVVSFYAIKQDTAPATTSMWLNKTGTKVLKEYKTSWVNVAVQTGDTLMAYDPVTKDMSTYVYNGSGWITNTENGMVAESKAVTDLTASLNTTNGVVGGHTTQLSTVDTRIANGVASVETKWAYDSVVNINGVYKKSGFGLTTNYTSGSGTQADPYVSEFWIDASRFKFTNSMMTGSVAPFTIDASGTTPQITFNGKVTFSNVTGVNMSGSNLLYNSAPTRGIETKGWQVDYNTTGIPSSGLLATGDTYRPIGGAAFHQYIPGTPAVGTVFDIRAVNAIPVIGGQYYEGSAYLNSHRCDSRVYVGWIDSSGSTITWSLGDIVAQTNTGNVLSTWGRSKFIVQAPANAASCYFYVRGTSTGEVNPYVFASMCYFGVASEGQTVYSNWSDGISASNSSDEVVGAINAGNTTTIDGGRITTGSITANQINTTGLIAENISATEIVGKIIKSSTLESTTINARDIKIITDAGLYTKSVIGAKSIKNINSSTSITFNFELYKYNSTTINKQYFAKSSGNFLNLSGSTLLSAISTPQSYNGYICIAYTSITSGISFNITIDGYTTSIQTPSSGNAITSTHQTGIEFVAYKPSGLNYVGLFASNISLFSLVNSDNLSITISTSSTFIGGYDFFATVYNI